MRLLLSLVLISVTMSHLSIVEQNNLKMQRGIDWALTLFILSLFFTSRADWWSVNNQISSMISLNVVTLEKAVVTVHTIKLDMTHVWIETVDNQLKFDWYCLINISGKSIVIAVKKTAPKIKSINVISSLVHHDSLYVLSEDANE